MRTRCFSLSAADECSLTYGVGGVALPMCWSPWDNRGSRTEGTVEHCWHWTSGGPVLIEFEVEPVRVFVLSGGRIWSCDVAIGGEASTLVNRSTGRQVQLEKQ